MQEFSWKIETEHKKRGVDWFWAIGLITLVGAVAAMFLGNAIFGIFILLAGSLLFYFNMRPIPIVSVVINEKEISINGVHYKAKKMRAFSVIKNHRDDNVLLVRTDRFFMPLLTIPLPDEIDPQEVEEMLEKKIKKEVIAEPPASVLADKLGF